MMEVNRIGNSKIHEAFLSKENTKLLDFSHLSVPGLANILYLSFEFFGEHCTECAAPDCHSTCDLFERGVAGLCRRFDDGIVVKSSKVAPFNYCFEILFRPGSRLMCVGNALCVHRRLYGIFSPFIPIAGRLTYILQASLRFLPSGAQWKITDKMRGIGNYVPRFLNKLGSFGLGKKPNAILFIIGNPHNEEIKAEMSLSGFGESQEGRSYRKTVILPHGWTEVLISIKEIINIIDIKKLHRICVVPLLDRPRLLQFLYGGYVNMIVPEKPKKNGEKKIKLLIIDLDNTIWDGILIEDPDKRLSLRPGVLDAIKELDRRGVLLSVASRNNYDDAKHMLESLGIWDYFLYPQIDWKPKIANINNIIQSFNIDVDTVAFIDDMVFEREAVRAALPQVRTYDAAIFHTLTQLEEFDVPVTEESGRRRISYMEEKGRKAAFTESILDYDSFLRACNIMLTISALNDQNQERVVELIQRTNQLNFSANHYSRGDLINILKDKKIIPIVMRCHDKFGDYGLVGFSMVKINKDILEVIDMMFSCRVQGKKVEHSFLQSMIETAKALKISRCVCLFRGTSRNAPASKVFEDLGFSVENIEAGNAEKKYFMDTDRYELLELPVRVVDELGLNSTRH